MRPNIFQRSLAGLLLAGLSLAPQAAAQWKYCQPWNRQLDAHDSRVLNCQNPAPAPLQAFDDFRIEPCDIPDGQDQLRIPRLVWWGTLENPQVTPVFRISFHFSDAANCLPAQQIVAFCPVNPKRKFVGIDCEDKPVFKFVAPLVTAGGTPLTLPPGDYWLSIAELDQAAGGAVNFRWSGHREVKNCPAAQRAAGGAWIQPLFSACKPCEVDLAFCLMSKVLAVKPAQPGGPVVVVQIFDPAASIPLASLLAEDRGDGVYEAYPEIPEGPYEILVSRDGSLSDRVTAVINSNDNPPVPVQLPPGDLDGDGEIEIDDLLFVLANFGLMGP